MRAVVAPGETGKKPSIASPVGCAFAPPPHSGRTSGNMETTKNNTVLSPQQQAVLTRLLPVAKIATNGSMAGLPVQPRTHSLVIGPSGGGKSHLARSLGERLGLPVLVINVSSWVVLSARNEPWTFSVICQWLDSLQRGGILVLDEVDKLHGPSDWIAYIRHEAHDLLDGIIPLAARLPPVPTDDPWDTLSDIPQLLIDREVLEKRLKERVFILACGAWQSSWRDNTRKLGFTQEQSFVDLPGHEQILQSIEPELRQRFRNEVLWLPPMCKTDYQSVSSDISKHLRNPLARNTWNRLSGAAIEEAVAAGLGFRVFEELMLSVLLKTPDPEEPSKEDYNFPDI